MPSDIIGHASSRLTYDRAPLIERMTSLIRNTLKEIESTAQINPLFIDNLVDFMLVYADLTHHGKGEGILFKELLKQNLSVKDQKMMDELIEGHVLGPRTTSALNEANIRYRAGDTSALKEIEDNLYIFVDFYPSHIEKEDKVFFPASRAYFTDEEDRSMLVEFRGFDQKMIHEKYKLPIQGLEIAS